MQISHYKNKKMEVASVMLCNAHKQNKTAKSERSFTLFLVLKFSLELGFDFEFGSGLTLKLELGLEFGLG